MRTRHRTAHPRSRGENGRSTRGELICSGSSPLTRGKRANARLRRGQARLIPAHAGKTPGAMGVTRRRTAHPRSRGENQGEVPGVGVLLGSSPLTRGKPTLGIALIYPPRLIPAHAGKTSPSKSPKADSAAHPRSRGENVAISLLVAYMQGSSPLTRGKRCPSVRFRGLHGLIPAHAGKTRPCRPPSTTETAHPRSRGENARSPPRNSTRRGSSPLTRGKPALEITVFLLRGLIPAHAGKTSSPTSATD